MAVLRSSARTDVGRKRKHNEDSFLADDALGLYVVADGMGGHAAGEIASKQAIESIRAVIAEGAPVLAELTSTPTAEAREHAAQLMEKAILKASADVYALGGTDPGKRGMGTTAVVLLVAGDKAVVGHVGDSRVYLHRNGRTHQLTEDHTFIQEQLKRGLITREQATGADNKNVITRAIGIQPQVAVDTLVVDVLPADLFVLCSDGLHGYLADEEIPRVFAQDRTKLADALVNLALDRGGKDNVTVVSLSVDDAVAADAGDAEAKTDILRRIPLFQHMTYKELLALLAIAQGRRFEKGQHIINEGERGNEMFVLFRGRVDVLKSGHRIAQLSGGGHFGEMGLVDRAPRSATIVAAEDTSAISIDRDSLLRLMRRESLLAVKLLWSFVQVLGERLRTTSEALTALKVELDEVRSPKKNSGPRTYSR
jgi:serine/threonine protein phosphatase PrpC